MIDVFSVANLLFNQLIKINQKCPASLGTALKFKIMEWSWNTMLPFVAKDGRVLKNLSWHRQKVNEEGDLFLDGCDPEELIDVGREVIDQEGVTKYQVVSVIERRDHKGLPKGNNAYFKVRCERVLA